MFQVLFLLLLAALCSPAFAEEVKIGRMDLSCKQHQAVPKSPWTDKITSSSASCMEHGKLVRDKRDEYSSALSEATRLSQKVATSQMGGSKDSAELVDSLVRILDSAVKGYSGLEKKTSAAAEELKKKRQGNESSLKALQARLPQLHEEIRRLTQEHNRTTKELRRLEAMPADSVTAAQTQQVEKYKSDLSRISVEKKPIEEILQRKLYEKAAEEQGLAVVASRQMEKILLEASRGYKLSGESTQSKKAKLEQVKLASLGAGGKPPTSSQISEAMKGESAAAIQPKKESWGEWAKQKSLLIRCPMRWENSHRSRSRI